MANWVTPKMDGLRGSRSEGVIFRSKGADMEGMERAEQAAAETGRKEW